MSTYSIIYAFSRMIEYQIVKDDTAGWRRMEKNRPKGVVYSLFDQANYPQDSQKNLQRKPP